MTTEIKRVNPGVDGVGDRLRGFDQDRVSTTTTATAT